MSDQPNEYTPGMFSQPSQPDYSPGHQQPGEKKPAAMVRRSVAILLTAGALVFGGGVGALIGSAPAIEARQDADQSNAHNVELDRQIKALKSDVEDKDAIIEDLEGDVDELENAPELLAAQKAEREAKEAAEKKKADEAAAAEKKAAEEKAAKAKAEKEAQEAEERKAAEEAARTFPGNGTFMVGEDIQPGRYKAQPAADEFMEMCYWARLSGTSGDFSDIITNHVAEGPTTVTISSSDVAFETNGCTMWERQG